jgi:hypothetical protein
VEADSAEVVVLKDLGEEDVVAEAEAVGEEAVVETAVVVLEDVANKKQLHILQKQKNNPRIAKRM